MTIPSAIKKHEHEDLILHLAIYQSVSKIEHRHQLMCHNKIEIAGKDLLLILLGENKVHRHIHDEH